MTQRPAVQRALLEIANLCVAFETREGPVTALQDVSLSVAEHECVAVVGESGSGKTQLFMAAMGLLPRNARATGSVFLGHTELLGAPHATLRSVRGARVGMVFQDPLSSLTPHLRIGEQLSEVLIAHGQQGHAEATATAVRALQDVGLPDPARRAAQYPHELSGGMRQRVALAAALIAGPQLLIADEPTTALDVSTQAQIVAMLRQRRDRGLGIVFISHDLALVATLADRVVVMYAGRIVESAPAAQLYSQPLHPYTRALLGAVPDLHVERSRRLVEIGGQPPRPGSLPPGCAFEPRCTVSVARCRQEAPTLETPSAGRSVACFVAMQGTTQ